MAFEGHRGAERGGDLPTGAPRRPAQPERRARRSLRLVHLISATTIGAALFAGLSLAIGGVRPARPLDVELDRLAERAGLAIGQVSLSGHRQTRDADIFDALDLRHRRSLLTFDARAVAARIERLPWVATASVTRLWPGQINIEIAERVPFAVWARGGAEVLIDATGRVLMPIAARSRPELPRVAGDGANTEAAAFLAMLSVYPLLGQRVAEAERIGTRRWTLELRDGRLVHLPAENVADALDTLVASDRGAALIDRDVAEIDLRVAGRIAVRRAAPSEVAPVAAVRAAASKTN